MYFITFSCNNGLLVRRTIYPIGNDFMAKIENPINEIPNTHLRDEIPRTRST
jgi:hypothetical protein